MIEKNDGESSDKEVKIIKEKTAKTGKEIKLTDRVVLDNLCNWKLNFRGIESDKDLCIPACIKGYRQLTVAEVYAQVREGNIYFCGTNGFGKNACVKIIDKEQARFIYDGELPVVLDVNAVKDLLAISNKKDFQDKLIELVITKAEKKMIVPLAKEAGIDNCESYKLVEIEKLSGLTF